MKVMLVAGKRNVYANRLDEGGEDAKYIACSPSLYSTCTDSWKIFMQSYLWARRSIQSSLARQIRFDAFLHLG
jgi:hypothetical protein